MRRADQGDSNIRSPNRVMTFAGWRKAEPNCVATILPNRAVFEVVGGVILLDSVDMVYLTITRPVAEKGSRNKLMDEYRGRHVGSRERHLQISATLQCRLNNP